MRRFEFVEGTSSKFWEITLDGSSFTVRYGRIGTDGQTQEKAFPSAEKAKSEHDKLVTEKTKKGYVEVGASPAAAPEVVAAPKAAKAAAKAPAKAAPPPAGDGWIDGGDGYQLSLREGKIVARNDKGKELASVPKSVKDGDAWEQLDGAREALAAHAADCRAQVETWMLRSLPVPRSALAAVWEDPDWRAPLEHLVVVAGGVEGLLRAVDPARGLGVVDLDGETRWLAADDLHIPHPILLAELDDWRALLADLGLAQGTPQLFRETFAKPAEGAASSVDDFAGGEFDLLAQVMGEARKLGYRVSGGCAVCRVWEGGALVEARYEIGEGDPMYETSTGGLGWVDARQRALTIAEVGPVAFSEGMRMASALYAKRKLEEKEEADD